MSDRDVVIRVENISKLYRLGEVGTGSLAHDVNRWWHKVRGKEDPYLKIGEVNDRTKSVSGSKKRSLTTIERHGGREKEQSQSGPKGEGMGTTESKDTENDSRASGEQTGSDSESVKFDSLDPSHLALRADLRSLHLAPAPALDCGKKSSSALDSGPSTLDSTHGLRAGEFFAVKDVSFELRRGELRTLGRSEKEISKKCLGATKGPDSGRSRHQCLGLIGHNGAGNQAAGQPLGRLPQTARRVNRGPVVHQERLPQGSSEGEAGWENLRIKRRGKARINMTLLKMLNGLIKPDAGSITMRGRVGALIALGAGFNPSREPKGWEARRTSNRRLALRVQCRRGGANQNI